MAKRPIRTKVIDGKKMADAIYADLKQQIAAFPQKPKLSVILIGDDPASQIYVKHKQKAAVKIGINSDLYQISPVTTTDAVVSFIHELNADPTVDGILVQLPLPKHLDSDAVIDAIAPEKDADGLHPLNLGQLFIGKPSIVPCTPLGCMKLIHSVCNNLTGKKAVIIGRSRLVGRPLGQLLLNESCTVVQAHSKTKQLRALCKTADILVTAAGCPDLITAKDIKPGAILIDVGINRLPDGHITGDMNQNGMTGIARAITPVPGGVGPMTVAMLMQNVVQIHKNRHPKTT